MTDKIIIYPDGDADTAKEFGQDQLQRLHDCGQFTLFPDVPESPDTFIARIQKAHIVLLGWGLPAEVMAAAPDLELISFTGTGVEKFVDMQQAKERGITVCNVQGYGDNAVAEHAMALLFACARNIGVHQKASQHGEWNPSISSIELKGKKLGVIGFGGIGQRFAALAHGLGMKISVSTRSAERYMDSHPQYAFSPLPRVLEQSDFISLHTAHSTETENMIDQSAFAMMKPGTILINTARGELIDESALVNALKDGTLAGAGLDVFRSEPLSADHALRNFENVVLTPHIAFSTAEATTRLNQIAVDNIVNYCKGNPTNVVTI